MSDRLINYSIAIDANTSKFIQGMGLARDEAAKVARTLRDSEPAAQKLSREIALLDKAFGDSAGKSRQYAAALDHLKNKYGEVRQAGDAWARQLAKTSAAQKQAGTDAWSAGMQSMKLNAAWERSTNLIGQTAPWMSRDAARQAERLNAAWSRAASAVGQALPRRELLEYSRLLQDHISPNVERVRNRHNEAESSVVGFGRALVTLGAIYGASRIAKDTLQIAANTEIMMAQFEALTGSRSSAETLTQQMRKLDAETPMTIGGIAKAAQTMLSFGVAAESIVPNLRKFGDIVGGDEERLKQLSLAFSQMSSAGRLMGQDLLQMVQTGFNPLQVISERTGMSMLDLKKAMEDGSISIELVELAFTAATSAGGLFHNRMQKEAGTTMGQYRLLRSEIEKLQISVGTELLPIANDAMAGIRGLGESVSGTAFSLNHLVTGFRGSMAAALDLATALRTGVMQKGNWDAFMDSVAAPELAKRARAEEEWIMRKAKKGEWDKLKEAGVGKGRINQLKKEMAEVAELEAKMQGIVDGFKTKEEKEAEKSKAKEETKAQQLEKLAKSEYEQALKRLEIEKYGKAIAEENEAIRKKIAPEEAKRIGDLVRQTEELDRQQKAAEKYKRTIESEVKKEQTKIENAQQKMDKIGAVDSLNPETRRAGSVEAYKFSLQKQNDQVKRMEQQKKIAEAQLAVQRKTLSAVERLRPMVVVN